MREDGVTEILCRFLSWKCCSGSSTVPDGETEPPRSHPQYAANPNRSSTAQSNDKILFFIFMFPPYALTTICAVFTAMFPVSSTAKMRNS